MLRQRQTHSTQLATNTGSSSPITMDGQPVTLANGYPDAAGLANALTDTTGFTPSGTDFTANCGASQAAASCGVQYTPSGANGAFPIVSVNSGGC